MDFQLPPNVEEFRQQIREFLKQEWPPEPSYLVLGSALDAAKAIGTELRQNAIVWCGPDCLPQLILLR